MTTSRQGVKVSASVFQELKGIVAPTKKKVAELTSKSMMAEKLDSSIDSVNQLCFRRWRDQQSLSAITHSSQANADPHAKAASKSSEPASVVTEVEKRARATYMATMDSLSMSARRLANFMSCACGQPLYRTSDAKERARLASEDANDYAHDCAEDDLICALAKGVKP